jgi:hypothetical protein
VKSVENCGYVQADIDLVQNWCTENYMQINIHKNKLFLLNQKQTMFV